MNESKMFGGSQGTPEEIKKAEGTMSELQQEASRMHEIYSDQYERYAEKAGVEFSPEEKKAFADSVKWNPSTRHLTFSLKGKQVDMRYYEITPWNAKKTIGRFDATIDGKTVSTEAAEKLRGLYSLALYGVDEAIIGGNEYHGGKAKEEMKSWPKVEDETPKAELPSFLQPSKEQLEQMSKDLGREPITKTENDSLVDELLK